MEKADLPMQIVYVESRLTVMSREARKSSSMHQGFFQDFGQGVKMRCNGLPGRGAPGSKAYCKLGDPRIHYIV